MGAVTGAILGGAALASSIMGAAEARDAAKNAAAIQDVATRNEVMRMKEDFDIFNAQQEVDYIKSGVMLSGTPLAVMEDTKKQQEKEVEQTIEVGAAQAAQTRKAGRNAYIQGIVGGVTSGARTAYGLWGPK